MAHGSSEESLSRARRSTIVRGMVAAGGVGAALMLGGGGVSEE